MRYSDRKFILLILFIKHDFITRYLILRKYKIEAHHVYSAECNYFEKSQNHILLGMVPIILVLLYLQYLDIFWSGSVGLGLLPNMWRKVLWTITIKPTLLDLKVYTTNTIILNSKGPELECSKCLWFFIWMQHIIFNSCNKIWYGSNHRWLEHWFPTLVVRGSNPGLVNLIF